MKALTRTLLNWYAENHVLYPWRKTRQPYGVWLSEVLLQQTRIPVALSFYEKILNRYPNLKSLAEAEDLEFTALWSGIGYYRRAHNMLACAREIVRKHGGAFPTDVRELANLPGIGKYTAGAIRNICFNALTPAIDGNIRRVLSRLMMSDVNLERPFTVLGKGAPSSEFFQSLMELGERICTPEPQCSVCPVARFCKAKIANKQKLFPAKQIRKKTEVFHWYMVVLQSRDAIYYLQNPSRPFLKAAWMFPDLLLRNEASPIALMHDFHKQWGIDIKSVKEAGVIEHAVTYRKMFAHVLVPRSFVLNDSNGKWLKEEELQQHPTSSITRKILTSLNL